MNEVCSLWSWVEVRSTHRQWLVYVGKAASLSFLQLLRDTVTQHIGPSQFSHNVKSEDMLETEAQHDMMNIAEEHCGADDRQRFIQCYYAVVGGDILGLFYVRPDCLTNITDQRFPLFWMH